MRLAVVLFGFIAGSCLAQSVVIDASGREIRPPARVELGARWRAVEAVSRRQLHLSPHLPFGRFDFPPGANRLLGIWWAGRLIDPAAFDIDLRAKVVEFHRRFCHREPTPAQLDALMPQ